MSEERETEIVAGVIEGVITKKADTWQIEVRPGGSQYTKKLWTKSSTLKEAAERKVGEHGAFVCNASYWEGPNGQVRSLWVAEEAAEGAVSDSPATPAQGKAPEPGGIGARQKASYAPDLKDRMIVRQTALKVAAERTRVSPEEDWGLEVMREASRFERWVYRDIDEVPSEAALTPHDQDIPF